MRRVFFEAVDKIWCEVVLVILVFFFFFQAEDGIRDKLVTGVQTCALPIYATLNPGGVRIGTAEIYRVVERIAEVEEAVAIGQIWQSDTRVVLFVRLRDGQTLDADLAERIRSEIRRHASPRHVPAKIVQVPDIPRTKNGKVVELAVKAVVHGMPVPNTDALANPEALELFRDLPQLSEL